MALWIALLLGVQTVQRAPAPDSASQREAEKFFKTLFRDEYRSRSDTEKIILAQKLYTQALEIKDNPARQYVALRECHALSLQTGVLERAEKAVDALRERFDAPVAALRLGIAQARVKTAADGRTCANEHLAVAEEAAGEEDYETALKAVAGAQALARKAKEAALLGTADDLARDLQERKAKHEPIRRAFDTLERKPDDPEANLLAGRHLALAKGDWERALPMLEKGSDPALRQLATWDLAGPARPAEQIAVADGWWQAGETEPEREKAEYRRRAAHWYAKVLPSASEAGRARAAARLKEAGVEVKAEGGATLGPYALDEEGCIRNWLVLGPFRHAPFSNLKQEFLEDEAEHVPSAGAEVDGGDGRRLAWQPVAPTIKRVQFFHLAALGFKGQPANNVTCYAAAWLDAEEDVEVVVRLGSDDGYRLWIDHQEIGASTMLRGFQWDSNLHRVKLTKGRHLLMIRVFTGTGGFEFAVRLTTPGLEVPRGIRIWN